MATGSAAGTVVLVHGGFVDGSGWQGVYDELKKDGYSIAVVQNPTISHADDVAVTKRVIDAQSEPVTLVGHSYGGGGHQRGWKPSQGCGARLRRGLRAGQGRVGEHPHRGLPDRRPAAADSAATGRVSLPRPGEVPCFIRW
jgi:hypothetical protein